jgi:hypothetical protein
MFTVNLPRSILTLTRIQRRRGRRKRIQSCEETTSAYRILAVAVLLLNILTNKPGGMDTALKPYLWIPNYAQLTPVRKMFQWTCMMA